MEYKTIKVKSYYDIPEEGAWKGIHANGNKYWVLNGQLHREDGPAIIYADGTQFWFLNGQRYRENGPAIIWVDGSQEWYLNDQRHRGNGPAIIYSDGVQEWYLNGQLHRGNGPAIIFPNGNKNWYLNGIQISQKAVENPKALTINEIINWKNVEGQREMINIYGLERFIFDSKPKIIDVDYHDQNGHRVLLKIKGLRGQWLCCSCPSTGRTYFMRIPDRINTCEKADKWLSGSLKARQVGRT